MIGRVLQVDICSICLQPVLEPNARCLAWNAQDDGDPRQYCSARFHASCRDSFVEFNHRNIIMLRCPVCRRRAATAAA